MAICRFFKMAAATILYFQNVEILGNGKVEDGQSATSCQIAWRSVKPLLRYVHFLIFQDGGRRRLEFSECGNFRSKKAQEKQNASPCQISRRSVKPLPRSCHFYSAHNARIASAVLAIAIPSVRLSVCPPHAGIVSKRRHVARCCLHRWIAKCV